MCVDILDLQAKRNQTSKKNVIYVGDNRPTHTLLLAGFCDENSMNFSTFFYTPKSTHMCVLFYLARHVVATHLEHLQLVPNLLKIFGTPSSIFVQLG